MLLKRRISNSTDLTSIKFIGYSYPLTKLYVYCGRASCILGGPSPEHPVHASRLGHFRLTPL